MASLPAPLRQPHHPFSQAISLSAAGLVLAAAAFAGFLVLVSRDPVQVMAGLWEGAFGGYFEFSETLVKATPILLTSLAVALPARAGLINLGAEGQLILGAIGGSWVALWSLPLPGWAVLPCMFVVGGLCGAAWAGLPAVLRAWFGASEVLVTLLLNYVATYLLEYLVHGPWRDPGSFGWPFSRAFPAAALLSTAPGTRVNVTLLLGILAAAICFLFLRWSSWGFSLRVVGENVEAARHLGLPWRRFLLAAMLAGGLLAAWAGVGEVSAIQGRLREGFSPGYGYTGFLVAWIARNRIAALPLISLGVAAMLAGGDSLQISSGLPQATLDVLQGLLLLCTLVALSLRRSPGAVR